MGRDDRRVQGDGFDADTAQTAAHDLRHPEPEPAAELAEVPLDQMVGLLRESLDAKAPRKSLSHTRLAVVSGSPRAPEDSAAADRSVANSDPNSTAHTPDSEASSMIDPADTKPQSGRVAPQLVPPRQSGSPPTALPKNPALPTLMGRVLTPDLGLDEEEPGIGEGRTDPQTVALVLWAGAVAAILAAVYLLWP